MVLQVKQKLGFSGSLLEIVFEKLNLMEDIIVLTSGLSFHHQQI